MNIIKFEVIADYPGQMYEIGDIIDVYEETGMAYIVMNYDDSEEKYDVIDFPALFKQIE